MRKPLLVLSLLTLSSVTFAQTIDYDAINEQARAGQEATERARQEARAQIKRERKEAIKNAVSTATEQWDNDFERTIPKKRNLTEVETAQVETLKCVEKLVLNTHGGIKFAEIAASFVEKITVSDVPAIEEVTLECEEALEKIKPLKLKKEEALKALDHTSMKNNTQKLLRKLLQPHFNCETSGVHASAGVMFGAGVGVMKIRCLGSNGKIISAVGPEATVGAFIGVNVGVYKHYYGNVVNAGPIMLGGADEGAPIGVGLTSIQDIDYGELGSYSSAGVGLSIGLATATGRLGLRLPNGQRRWELLTDLLK